MLKVEVRNLRGGDMIRSAFGGMGLVTEVSEPFTMVDGKWCRVTVEYNGREKMFRWRPTTKIAVQNR